MSELPTELDGYRMDPLVSVIIPTYKDGEYVQTALRSVAAQTHQQIEAIVVDGSNDQAVKDLVEPLEWCRYVYQTPQGPGAARNYGLSLASGDYYAFLDADDRWLPKKLERQLAAAEDGAEFVYSDQFIES